MPPAVQLFLVPADSLIMCCFRPVERFVYSRNTAIALRRQV